MEDLARRVHQARDAEELAKPYADASDGLLLEAVLARDEAAWRELTRRFRGLVFRCITKITSRFSSRIGQEDLDEILAEVWLGLVCDDMRRLRRYDPSRGTKLGSWLGLLASNATYDHLRRSTRIPRFAELTTAPESVSVGPSALDLLLEEERHQRLHLLLTGLGDRDRRFVELHYGCGLTAEEVAATMGISVKTVYSKHHKLRAKLLSLAALPESEPTHPRLRLRHAA